MEGFITEYWEVAATIISILAGGWVVLGTALARAKFGQIKDEQDYQNHRLNELEVDVGNLKGDRRELSTDLKNLGKLLDEFRKEQREENKANREEHGQIKDMIRQQTAEVRGT